MAAGDPLPRTSSPDPPLWLTSLQIVKRGRPDVVILVCNWEGQLKRDQDRLRLAIRELAPLAGKIILITQPPQLPKLASREGIRNGIRAPFEEDPNERRGRMTANGIVKSQEGGRVTVLDIESLFSEAGGAVRFANADGKELYQDGAHLSAVGALQVKPLLRGALVQHKGTISRTSHNVF